MSDHEVNRFLTWTHETLASFAAEANRKIIEQAEENQQLREDLKTALEAYRALVRRVG